MSDQHLPASDSLDHGKANGHLPDQVFRDPTVKDQERWRVAYDGRVLPTDWTSRGAAEAFLTNLREDGMTAKAKKYMLPPKTKKRLPKGTGKLSRHVKHEAGSPVPYRFDEKERPLWKYTARTPWGCLDFAARDDEDAVRLFYSEVLPALKAKHAAKQQATEVAKAATAERTMAQLAEHFLATRGGKDSKTRDRTVAGYRANIANYIEPFFRDWKVTDVTPEVVDAWKAAWVDGKGKSRTRAARVTLLGMLFKHAVTYRWCPYSPVLPNHRVPVLKASESHGKLVGDQRATAAFSREELERVVGALDPNDPALRLLVELTGQMGFRLREATHLRIEDVDVDRPDGAAFITVASGRKCGCWDCRRNGNVRLTKSGTARPVPVPQDLVDAVRSHLEALRTRFGANGYLFPVWRSKPGQLSAPGAIRVPKVVAAAFKRAAAAAGRPDLIFHDLRGHAKGALRKQAGANNDAIDKALGHRLPGMSEIYVTFTPEELYRGCYPKWTPRLTVVKEAKTA